MNNEKALNLRKTLPKVNNFSISELRKMPRYFGWVSYSVNKKKKVVV